MLIVKYLLTAALVVLISEVAKRYEHLGALIAALPVVTLLVLIWMQVEGQPADKISDHARYTFWYVVPTLPMFLFFPWCYQQLGFWPALGAGVLITLVSFVLWAWVARYFGVTLLWFIE